MDSNLLKEAIADAKAVRQTALANAKAALEEAFGSRLEAMLSPKLDEETADEVPAAPAAAAAPAAGAPEQSDIDDIIKELEAELPQDGAAPAAPLAPAPMGAPMGDPAAALGAAPAPAPVGAAPIPAPMPAAPAPAPMDPAAAAPVAPAPAPAGPEGAAPAPAAGEPDGDEGGKEGEVDEEIDINELLESLKADEENEDKDGDKEKGNKPPWLKEETDLKSSGIAGGDNKMPASGASSSSKIETAGKDKVGGGEGYKGGPADATTASRPNQAKNATKDNLSTPGGALKETKETGFPEGATVKTDDATKAERPNQAKNATKDNLSTPALAKENAELKSQLSEAEQALTYLRTQLNEINLLNAKLLYTNKLFKEFTMANDKKMKIVEMFDLAKNVREVKMTYAVIAESLNFGADFKKKTPSKVQNITEGMASQPVAGTAPKQIIAESAKSEMVSKFQRLAGIQTTKATK